MPVGWFFIRDDQTQGPIGLSELVELVQSSRLQPAALVWREGLAEWVSAGSLPEIAERLVPPAVPSGAPPEMVAIPAPVPPPAVDLGALRAELRRGEVWPARIVVGLSGAALLGLLWIAVAMKAWVLPLMVSWLPLMILIAGVVILRTRLLVHEQGLVTQGLLRRRLRFDDATSLEHRTVVTSSNYVPTGTFAGGRVTGRSGERLKYGVRLGLVDGDRALMDELRDRLAAAVANRHLEKLARGEAVAWGKAEADGPQVQLTRDALTWRPLVVRTLRLPARGERVPVPYPAIGEQKLHRGSLTLYDAGGKELFELQCDEPDFWPGYLLLQHFSRKPGARR